MEWTNAATESVVDAILKANGRPLKLGPITMHNTWFFFGQMFLYDKEMSDERRLTALTKSLKTEYERLTKPFVSNPDDDEDPDFDEYGAPRRDESLPKVNIEEVDWQQIAEWMIDELNKDRSWLNEKKKK